jgi:hypothetical protein
MEQLLNLLNPVYALGNIVREADAAINACDLSQPHTWLLIASTFCLGEAAFVMLTWVEKKMLAFRKR